MTNAIDVPDFGVDEKNVENPRQLRRLDFDPNEEDYENDIENYQSDIDGIRTEVEDLESTLQYAK